MAELHLKAPPLKVPAMSSICEARTKVGFLCWQKLIPKIYFLFRDFFGEKLTWKGFHIYAIDGSKTNLPRELVKLKYKKPSPNSYYPQGMISALYDVNAKMPVNLVLSRHHDERRISKKHLPFLDKNCLVLYDRHYFARWLFALHLECGVHAVFRLKTKLLKEFNEFLASDSQDAVIDIRDGNGGFFKVRFIKASIKSKPYYFATTLLDQVQFSAAEIVSLYAKRWTIEEGFKFIKQDLCLEKYHSKNPDGVKQELMVNAILLQITRVLGVLIPKTKRSKKLNYKPHQGILVQSITSDVLFHQWKDGKVSHQLVSCLVLTTKKFLVSSPPNRCFERRNRSPKSKAQRLRSKYRDRKKHDQHFVRQAFPP